MKKAISLFYIIILISAALSADNISILGIDTESMIFNGKISLYLTITDQNGSLKEGVTIEEIQILESIDNKLFLEREITTFTEGMNENKGINFQLLIDNSGSMYETIEGKETENYEETRISAAIGAIKTLINSMQGSKDKAGISYFNTFYNQLVPVSSNRNLVLESLQMIEKPGKDESFTELNAAVFSSAQDISVNRGRKIIIVLSDGENYPYSAIRNEDSPQFGNSIYSTEDMISELKLNSTTLYAINFGSKRDPSLEKVVIETGGFLFEADSEESLALVYQNIRDRVLSEYYLEFNTDTIYSDQKYVKALLKDGSVESGTVYYFSGNLFGNPSDSFSWFFFVGLPLAVIVLILLAYQKLSSPAEKAELEVKDFSGSTQTFEIKDNKTVIGSSNNDDITIATDEESEKDNATIVFDEKKSEYTIISDKEVMVNNNPVKTRILEPGDVINIDGATVVFNDKE